MLYANVVLGLPVDVAFDYSVPLVFHKDISVGSRVLVNFRNKKSIGYIAGFTHKTKIKNIKDILGLIDEKPILDKRMFSLARKIADYYCCSFGEAIETMLPQEVRKGRIIDRGHPAAQGVPCQSDAAQGVPCQSDAAQSVSCCGETGATPTMLHDLEPKKRWEIYIEQIKKMQDAGKSAIILFNDIQSVLKAKEILRKAEIKDIELLYRREKEEFQVWQEVRCKDHCVVVGTRSAVFAPVNKLGLIILDHEEDSVYKQEQVPHYHAKTVALLRFEIEGAKIILESASPDLESFLLAQKDKFSFQIIQREKKYPEVRIIDTKRVPYAQRKSKAIFSRALIDEISAALNCKGKVLVLINRKGFATYAACHNCGKALKCPACNVSLVYHFDEDMLRCHHCAFKMVPPEICPNCNAGYIKYSGIGTDKVESELARIFPQARIGEEILVSTSIILKDEERNFDLICVLGINNAINRVDYMASEKAFYLLSGLIALTDKKMIIPTSFPGHHCLESLVKADPKVFYTKELRFRKQLKYAPFKHMALVKVRGRDAEKVKKAAEVLFDKLKAGAKGIDVLSLSPGQPHKLRGNFYWQILLSGSIPKTLSKFLKIHLKDFRYSGIIVTVDVDPL